jgi:PII-like signaling protein
MEKLKEYKKQIIIGLLLLIGAIMGVKIMVNNVEVVEEVPVVCEVVDTTKVDTTKVVKVVPAINELTKEIV